MYHLDHGVVAAPYTGSQNGFLVYDLKKDDSRLVSTKSRVGKIGFLNNSIYASIYEQKEKTTSITRWVGLNEGGVIEAKNNYLVNGRIKLIKRVLIIKMK